MGLTTIELTVVVMGLTTIELTVVVMALPASQRDHHGSDHPRTHGVCHGSDHHLKAVVMSLTTIELTGGRTLRSGRSNPTLLDRARTRINRHDCAPAGWVLHCRATESEPSKHGTISGAAAVGLLKFLCFILASTARPPFNTPLITTVWTSGEPVTFPGNNPVSKPLGPGYVRPSIPLTPEQDVNRSDSIGSLVKDATTQVSTLVRAEIELAKVELVKSAKQGAIGAVFFIVAGVIGLFSLFFFWLMVGEILDIWLPRWLSFVIVFVAMLVIAGALVFLGILRIKKIKKPERTIASLQDTAATLKRAASRPDAPAA